MLMIADDAELLRRYSRESEEEAFAELVQRYLALVYHAALRQVGGDAPAAEDVTQKVFMLLARKAHALTEHATLAGWLHTTTRFAASETMRADRRRRAREQEAHLMQELSPPDTAAHTDWDRLRPVIDEALGELNERDREAVLLRFFANLPFAAVGARLNVSEDAARVRVDRALDKLHRLLARRGVTSTTAVLAAVFANEASAGVPAGLATTVTSAALAGGGAMAAVTFVSAIKIGVGIAAVAVAAGTVGLVLQYQANAQLQREVADLRQQNEELAQLRPENERLAKAQADAKIALTDLRAEVVSLQSQLATKSGVRRAADGGDGGESPPATADGAARMPNQFQVSSILENRYTGLIKDLKLTLPQWDQLRILLLAKQKVAADTVDAALKQGMNLRRNLGVIRQMIAEAQAPVNAQIQTALGDSGYAVFQDYELTLPQHVTVDNLAQMLRATPAPLTDDQARHMVEILSQTEEPQGKGGLGRILNGNVNSHSKITAQTIVRAAEVLSVEQVQALKQLQLQQLGMAGEGGDGAGASGPDN